MKTGTIMPTKYAALIEKQRDFFATGATRNVEFRIRQLKRLQQWIVANEDTMLEALKNDLGKSAFEAYATEIMGPLEELKLAIKKIKGWARPRRVKTPIAFFKARSYYQHEPFGAALVISAWNYPFSISLAPLIGAIAAGNCCVLKPSELAACTSKCLADMARECFAEDYCAVIEGGAAETTELLAEKFDIIHYTGGARVGRIVALAAAANLTPIVLEMGGKSPCIVDETADIDISARRIAWGKFLNAGQTCTAPDYVLAHRSIKEKLVSALQSEIRNFYGPDAKSSQDYGRIINENHFDRLSSLLRGEHILSGGATDRASLYVEPTILDPVSWDSEIMKEEIFGPILPIIVYDDMSDLILILKKREKPLALYVFSKNAENTQRIINEIPFGGGGINSTVLQSGNIHLPFGGVGASGMGHYHGEWSFKTFSHKKSILDKSSLIDIKFMYPPYKDKLKWLKKL